MHEELIARLEAASADQQRELLIEAWGALRPEPPIWGGESWGEWWSCKRRFRTMLKAEAYESAALTLVDLSSMTLSLSIGALNLAFLTVLSDDALTEPPCFEGTGATPALAICIAAIKARGGE